MQGVMWPGQPDGCSNNAGCAASWSIYWVQLQWDVLQFDLTGCNNTVDCVTVFDLCFSLDDILGVVTRWVTLQPG